MILRQKGQAVVEMALVMPLLITLLLAAGYFGHIVASQQSLNMAARNAAREMAYESTQSENDRILGTYQLKATAEKFETKAESTLSGLLGASKLSAKAKTKFNFNYNQSPILLTGEFASIHQHMFVYRYQEAFDLMGSFPETPVDREGKEPYNLSKPLKFGIGAVFYGGTLQYDLDELNPLARFIFRLNQDPTIRIGATSLMPAELPLRGAGYGLLNLNPWIKDIVTTGVSETTTGSDGKQKPIYPGLFD